MKILHPIFLLSRRHNRAAPYFFTFHMISNTMGSKEARNSRQAMCLHSSFTVGLQVSLSYDTLLRINGARRHLQESYKVTTTRQLLSRRRCWRHGFMAARQALASGTVRTRSPGLKMESTDGVSFRVASTIQSKFVFSRNRTGGGRLSDRLLKRAPTCSSPQLEVHEARRVPIAASLEALM